jgi:putative ABC transport system ATP-binding protein
MDKTSHLRHAYDPLTTRPRRARPPLAMSAQSNPSSSTPIAPPSAPLAVAALHHVHKSYQLDQVKIPVLRDINILIRPARFTVLAGASGSGKTTLLNLIGCIDRPDSGTIVIEGVDVDTLSNDALSDFRARHLGFIFQNFNLLPVLSAYENVEYPMLITGVPIAARRARVPKLLAAVGLSDRARNRPNQLSGGQRQRVAIARALACSPKIVIADEPTANLDSKTGASILALMRSMQQRLGISFIFSSHDHAVLAQADDIISIVDGMVVSIQRRDRPALGPAPAPRAHDPIGLA